MACKTAFELFATSVIGSIVEGVGNSVHAAFAGITFFFVVWFHVFGPNANGVEGNFALNPILCLFGYIV